MALSMTSVGVFFFPDGAGAGLDAGFAAPGEPPEVAIGCPLKAPPSRCVEAGAASVLRGGASSAF
jgi:hypothetical protein